MEWKTETRGQGKKRVIRKWQTRWRQTENRQKWWAYEAAQLTRSLKVGKYCNSICCLFSKCDTLKNYGQMNRTCWISALANWISPHILVTLKGHDHWTGSANTDWCHVKAPSICAMLGQLSVGIVCLLWKYFWRIFLQIFLNR